MMKSSVTPDWMEKTQQALVYYQQQLSIPAIEKYNAIVQVGEMLTLTHDEHRQTYLHNTFYPTTYTQEMAEKLAKSTFRDAEGQPVVARVVFAKDWYRQQYAEITALMPQLHQLAQMHI